MLPAEFGIRGLTDSEVTDARLRNGTNTLHHKKENAFLNALQDLVKEPMLILLLVAAIIYFIGGNTGDGIFMVSAIILVTAISLYQDSRSRNALAALKNITQPKTKVIRNGQVSEINIEDIVVGDYCICEEGTTIPADGFVVQSNDFSVNESILTGESFTVGKNNTTDNKIFQGTWVTGGLAVCRVNAIGNHTELGKIGNAIATAKETESPLQRQIYQFVKMMAITGSIIFLIVWGINFSRSGSIIDSLLKALTLAMSILPEEIPVAFTTFMALGAWRLMKMGIIVKQTKTVETLGSATVICTDKTGTITENRMQLSKIYLLSDDVVIDAGNIRRDKEKMLIRYAMWSSEPIPFDPMETAIHDAYIQCHITDERPDYKMLHEYPLDGNPPMMTHIFENAMGQRIIAAKGAPEAILKVSHLLPEERDSILKAVQQMSAHGLRVLAVARTDFAGNSFPGSQQHFSFNFLGLLGFYDPPKKNIAGVFENFYKAGIQVKIVTGDNTLTTVTIAQQVGLRGHEKALSGDELMHIDEGTLKETVLHTNIFTRMFPEAKLKIINALKDKNQIVAMTGDGVNDGPALKASHIGIAMGKKGSEIARQASSLILTDDDLSKMVDAVAMGRKIYSNLKKAIQYIISIHIPIILTVLIPLVAGWAYPAIFTPVHIIFLELIMGPTCSIIYENEPMEKNTMMLPPRPVSTRFFSWHELATSVIQGLVITAGTLACYQIAVYLGANENITRTMVFSTLIVANIILTLVNRSFYYSLFTTLQYKNRLVPLIIGITLALMLIILFIPVLRSFFYFELPGICQSLISIGIGLTSVIWYEMIKWYKRKKIAA